jgi:uncharacterized membrane protein YhaH (DUF805 family)
VDWYFEVLKKYAVFSGRARRKEYWYYSLVSLIIILVLAVVDHRMGNFDSKNHIGLLGGIYILATTCPNLAVAMRRLHDTGRSGWWFLLAFIPIGNIIFFIFLVFDSEPGTNQYGPNPKNSLMA